MLFILVGKQVIRIRIFQGVVSMFMQRKEHLSNMYHVSIDIFPCIKLH